MYLLISKKINTLIFIIFLYFSIKCSLLLIYNIKCLIEKNCFEKKKGLIYTLY